MDLEDNQHSSSFSSPEIISAAAGSSSRKRNDGRKKFKVTRHPIYRGVRRRNGDKWVCEVREPNTQSRIWLGTFSTPEMAAAAHDAAAVALRGEDARLNFPESAHLLPRAASSSHEDIRRAALQAAAGFKPSASLFDAGNPSLSSSLAIENGGANGVGFDTFGSENVSNNNGDGNTNSGVEFVDEEAIYNMPVLLDSMAEGMLLTPMAMKKGFNWGHEVDDEMEITLWGD